jgi:Ras-related GTP-binding protein C/D
VGAIGFLENLLDSLIQSCSFDKAFFFDVDSKLYVATDSNPVDMQTYELCSDMIDVVIDVSTIYGHRELKETEEFSYAEDSQSIIHLSNGNILYLREVFPNLALVCLMREESFAKSGIVEYNVMMFKKAVGASMTEKNDVARIGTPDL